MGIRPRAVRTDSYVRSYAEQVGLNGTSCSFSPFLEFPDGPRARTNATQHLLGEKLVIMPLF